MQDLADLFPASDWVLSQTATAQYQLRNFDMAQALFEELRQRDPNRIEVRPGPLAEMASNGLSQILLLLSTDLVKHSIATIGRRGRLLKSTSDCNRHTVEHVRG